jgi:hypothetical protein
VKDHDKDVSDDQNHQKCSSYTGGQTRAYTVTSAKSAKSAKAGQGCGQTRATAYTSAKSAKEGQGYGQA